MPRAFLRGCLKSQRQPLFIRIPDGENFPLPWFVSIKKEAPVSLTIVVNLRLYYLSGVTDFFIT